MVKNEFIKGYKLGVIDGRKENIIKLQENNCNSDLPSNETLYKIFKLLFECIENDRKTSSVYMNAYQHYAKYVTLNWDKELTEKICNVDEPELN